MCKKNSQQTVEMLNKTHKLSSKLRSATTTWFLIFFCLLHKYFRINVNKAKWSIPAESDRFASKTVLSYSQKKNHSTVQKNNNKKSWDIHTCMNSYFCLYLFLISNVPWISSTLSIHCWHYLYSSGFLFFSSVLVWFFDVFWSFRMKANESL